MKSLWIISFTLCVFMLLVGKGRAVCSTRATCGECIADSICSWCGDTSSVKIRCKSLSENAASCPLNGTSNPQSSSTPVVEQAFNTTGNGVARIQLSPQSVQAKLRVGVSHKVNITFRKLVEYPLDLYYVMDLSYSMSDDLIRLQVLGTDLIAQIKTNVTDNVNLGFGSFVDKVIMPFATDDSNWLINNCINANKDKPVDCQPTFGFHHQLALTDNSTAFANVVGATRISANIDVPEGTLDALMQIAVCQNIIKWRKESLRVVLVTTDAVPHQAMDGALIGILKPNDMKCHLTQLNSSEIYNYNESQYLDYPSVGQLKQVFEQHKIQTIFAVTDQVKAIYDKLPHILPNSFVETLKSDSSNILPVIQTSYNAIKSRFSLVKPSVPNHIDLKYRVLCPGAMSFTENALNCLNVSIGDDVVYQFELTAKSCPLNKATQDVISISSNIIPDVVNITIDYLCSCDCDLKPQANSTQCDGMGNLQCGVCNCYSQRSGKTCQCETNLTNTELDKKCTDIKPLEVGQAISICHGRGECGCGSCQCNPGFSGQYCECSNQACPSDARGICGGSQRGICKNCYGKGTCVCEEKYGWYLNSEGVCRCNKQSCVTTGTNMECSGNGICECDTCTCDNSTLWAGPLCNECINPTCNNMTGTCTGSELKQCAICVSESQGTSACKVECTDRGIGFKRVVSLPDCTGCQLSASSATCIECLNFDDVLFTTTDCSIKNTLKCTFSYKIVWHKTFNNYYIYVKNLNFETDCPKPVDPVIIVLPVVGAIVFGGLIALVVWKILKTNYDRRQYQEFMKSLKGEKWMTDNNPLHEKPTTRIENPKFIDQDDPKPSTSDILKSGNEINWN